MANLFLSYVHQHYKKEALSISDLFHENTKQYYFKQYKKNFPDIGPEWLEKMSQAYKKYKKSPRIKLSREFSPSQISLEEVLQKRRSVRSFADLPVDCDQLSHILHFSYGLTQLSLINGIRQALRAAPSAGALYPVEIYPVLFNCQAADCGIYHYNVEDHTLELLKKGDQRSSFHRSLLNQEFILQAAGLFILTAVFPRNYIKYGERGYRYVLLDAGHIAQNIYLTTSGLGLGCVAIGGFYDDEIHDQLELDGVNEAVVYVLAFGKIHNCSREHADE